MKKYDRKILVVSTGVGDSLANAVEVYPGRIRLISIIALHVAGALYLHDIDGVLLFHQTAGNTASVGRPAEFNVDLPNGLQIFGGAVGQEWMVQYEVM